jgi:ubiquitin-like-conjugating enzyme ATG3
MLSVAVETVLDFLQGGAPTSLLHRGQLSALEFVDAGDALVRDSPSWRWRTSSCPSPLLPASKQYLISEGLPLDHGVIDDAAAAEGGINEEDNASEISTFVDASAGLVSISSISSSSDPACAPGGGVTLAVSIVYNDTYKTPHLFISGTGATGTPLSPPLLLQIVSKDMAQSTATIERHPRTSNIPPILSLHPCRHASVMLAIFEAEKTAPNSEAYLRLWLRAISGALRVVIDHA